MCFCNRSLRSIVQCSPFSDVKKLRYREVKELAQGFRIQIHPQTTLFQSQVLNPSPYIDDFKTSALLVVKDNCKGQVMSSLAFVCCKLLQEIISYSLSRLSLSLS